jgi:hypothetical protein
MDVPGQEALKVAGRAKPDFQIESVEGRNRGSDDSENRTKRSDKGKDAEKLAGGG